VNALAPQPGGIGRYTWQLCKGLAGHPDIAELSYFGRGRLLADPSILLAGREPPRRGTEVQRLINDWRSRRLLRSTLFHAPNYFLPAVVESGVITVHDLSVFRYPETHPAERVRAFEREFARSLESAVHIITDTETVRRELIDDCGVADTRISAVPLGVDPLFRPQPADELAPLLAPFGLNPGGYGLCVSTLEPRKKIGELLEAWRLLPRPVRERFPLVLAGGSGWQNETLHEQVATAVAEGWLRHLGFVEESSLPALYAGAALFVYPSIYEGFGLPPLEAMASGVPVVVSNRSCLPEVCGSAVRQIDPDDTAGFVRELEGCLTDERWRHGAVKKGLTRANYFTWKRCIESTVAIYRHAASRI
jgi:alpha-1,3-rhamnosyl/mannosyltransferase